jgi:hypothetical protein
MRERILRYLEEIGRPATAEEVLRVSWNIRSPNALAAEKVLRGILGKDRRFSSAKGLWRAVPGLRIAPDCSIGALFVYLEQSNRCGGTCFRGAACGGGGGALWEFDLSSSSLQPDVPALGRLLAKHGSGLQVAWTEKLHRQWKQLLRSWRLEPPHGEYLSLRSLALRVLPGETRRIFLDHLASLLGLAPPDVERPASMVRFMMASLPALLERVPEGERGDPAALRAWIDNAAEKPDFSRFAFDREYLRGLPQAPGVYVMRNRAGDIIYIGKSHNLRRRVGTYFLARRRKDTKTSKILEQLHSLEIQTTDSEVEALLLETRLIRDFHPSINLQVELHETPSGYGKELNLVLLVPISGANRAIAYLLKAGLFAERCPIALGRPVSKALARKIRSLYFTGRRRNPSRESWEKEIVCRWLAVNRRQLNFVDVDDAGGFEDTVRQLNAYLADPGRLSEKVHYR